MKKAILCMILILMSLSIYAKNRPRCALSDNECSLEDSFFLDSHTAQNKISHGWLRSLAVGILIGGTTGALCGAIENYIGLWPWGWLGEYFARQEILDDVENDYKELGISYKRSVLRSGGWAASWIAYIAMVRSGKT